MAEQQAEEDNMNIFVYLGGEQVVPRNVTHVRIDRSVKIIPREAFRGRRALLSVETHDDLEKIEGNAFNRCTSLRGIKLPGVRIVEEGAFFNCTALSDVEFGDKLETIGNDAFGRCKSLQKIKMRSVRNIGAVAFDFCQQLADVELPCVDTIGKIAFFHCLRLRRVAIPLKDNIFRLDRFEESYTQFAVCENLATVDLVGGTHNTVSSLLLERWRDEMNQEINRINQVLPNTHANEKTDVIQGWIQSVIDRMEHYKVEHNTLLKENMTQLELAVWKAKLDDEEEGGSLDGNAAKKARIDVSSARKVERRITSGADIIIRNVLPFLQLSE
jgi:hypothetical protein